MDGVTVMKKILNKLTGFSVAVTMLFSSGISAVDTAQNNTVSAASVKTEFTCFRDGTIKQTGFTAPSAVGFYRSFEGMTGTGDGDVNVRLVDQCRFYDSVYAAGNTEINDGNIKFRNEDSRIIVYGNLDLYNNLSYELPGRKQAGSPEIICTGTLKFNGVHILYEGYDPLAGYTPPVYNPDPDWGEPTYSDPVYTEVEVPDSSEYLDVYCRNFEPGERNERFINLYCFGRNELHNVYERGMIKGSLVSAGSLRINSEMEIDGDLVVEENLVLGPNAKLKVGGSVAVGGIIENLEMFSEEVIASGGEILQLNADYMKTSPAVSYFFENEAEYEKLYDPEYIDFSGKEPSYEYIYRSYSEIPSMADRDYMSALQEAESRTVPEYDERFWSSIQGSVVELDVPYEDTYYRLPDIKINAAAIVVKNSNGNRCHFILGENYLSLENTAIIPEKYYNDNQTGTMIINHDDNINIFFHAPQTCMINLNQAVVFGYAVNLNVASVSVAGLPYVLNSGSVIYDMMGTGNSDSRRIAPFWVGCANFISNTDTSRDYSYFYGDYLYAYRSEPDFLITGPEDFFDQISVSGDINGDENINSMDVVILINMVTQRSLYGTYDKKYDLNGNGTVDVMDVYILGNYILYIDLNM